MQPILDEFLSNVGRSVSFFSEPQGYKIKSISIPYGEVDELFRGFKDLYDIDTVAFSREYQYREQLFALAIKDPKAFLIISNRQGEPIGYLSVFGFRNDNLLRNLEKQKQCHLSLPNLLYYYTDIVPRSEWGKQPLHIYVDAIALKGRAKNTIGYSRAVVALVAKFLSDLKESNPVIRSVSTLAIGKGGKELAENLIGVKPKTTCEWAKRYLYVTRFKSNLTWLEWLSERLQNFETHPGVKVAKWIPFFFKVGELIVRYLGS